MINHEIESNKLNKIDEKSSIPKKNEYKVKFVFKEDSNVDINNVIKECFVTQIRTLKLQKITQ